LTHSEIDKPKWDSSLDNCYNPLIYARSSYLDTVCDEWDALVMNDYDAMMPLPVRKKYGVYYVYQPFFCQQLGIFSKFLVSGFLVTKFLDALPDKFGYIDSQLNSSCSMDEYKNECITERKNHELLLLSTYEHHVRSFSENTKRNISKALKNELTFSRESAGDALVDFYVEQNGNKSPEVKQKDYLRFKELLKKPIGKEWQFLRVHNSQNETLAAGIFAGYAERLTYLMGASSEKGKELGSMQMLMNEVIKNAIDKYVVIDFEGSDIEGIARFYRGFGADEVPYFHYKENRLPALVRLLKR
jgi:lipid II:glycine glycyltransferase (peptidoglycan interpeptide bridge formation enzyme)